MECKIQRTSLWNDQEKPCEDAHKGTWTYVRTSKYTSPEEFNKNLSPYGERWEATGTNHCINDNGHIQKDIEHTGWFVTIETMEDLRELERKYGKLVIGRLKDKDDRIEIGIYDQSLEWRA